MAGRFRREKGSTEEPHEESHYKKLEENPLGYQSVGSSTAAVIREIEGRESEPNIVSEALRRSKDKLGKVKVFGQPLKEMLVGAAVGGAAKAAVRIGLGISGVGVVEMAILGAAGGTATAVWREYNRQRQELAKQAQEEEETMGYSALRAELKNRLKVKNGRKIVLAAARGAAFGAVGGVVGGTISEMILDHIIEPAVSGIKLPEFKISEIPEIRDKAGSYFSSFSHNSSVEEAIQATPSAPGGAPLPGTPEPPHNPLPPTGTGVPVETPVAAGTATPTETPTPTSTSTPASTGTPTPTAPVIPEAHEFAWEEPSAPVGPPMESWPGFEHPAVPSTNEAVNIASKPDIAPPSVEPAVPESLPPTDIHGHTIAGSALEDNLTFDGEHWAIVDNGVKNINHVFDAVGETGAIDRQALAVKLQEAVTLYAHGQLNPSANEDLYKVFHLSNGTGSIFNDLVNDDDTLESLKNLGIVK